MFIRPRAIVQPPPQLMEPVVERNNNNNNNKKKKEEFNTHRNIQPAVEVTVRVWWKKLVLSRGAGTVSPRFLLLFGDVL